MEILNDFDEKPEKPEKYQKFTHISTFDDFYFDISNHFLFQQLFRHFIFYFEIGPISTFWVRCFWQTFRMYCRLVLCLELEKLS